MTIPQDFKEFIQLLNKHEVRYLIVGGYAVGFYSRPKFTEDIDFWIECNESNAIKVLDVFILPPTAIYLVKMKTLNNMNSFNRY